MDYPGTPSVGLGTPALPAFPTRILPHPGAAPAPGSLSCRWSGPGGLAGSCGSSPTAWQPAAPQACGSPQWSSTTPSSPPPLLSAFYHFQPLEDIIRVVRNLLVNLGIYD